MADERTSKEHTPLDAEWWREFADGFMSEGIDAADGAGDAANDLGEKIGCGGHLTALRRTETDKFHIRDAKTLDELKAMAHADLIRQLIPPYQAVPSHVLS